jgi:predicted patatin/cPLA2 family phospholipase
MFPIVTTGNRDVLQAFFDSGRKLGVVACAGGIRNSHLSGAQILLRQRQRDLREPVAVIGVSSGYATRAYYQSGYKATDVRVFSDDMSTDSGRLFKLSRRLLGHWPFDIDYVDTVFRHGATGRPIKADRVLAHPTKLYGVLADPETGRGATYLPTTPEEVWDLATVATAVTGFAPPLTFRGRAVTDGYASDMHLPVTELIRLHPEVTDILVFASQHYEKHPRPASAMEVLLYRTGFAVASMAMREMIRTRHLRFMAEAERVIDPAVVDGRRVCIVWLPKAYHPIYVTEAESRDLIRLGYQTMKELLRNTRAG